MSRMVTPAHVNAALQSVDLSLVAVSGNRPSPFPGGGQRDRSKWSHDAGLGTFHTMLG